MRTIGLALLGSVLAAGPALAQDVRIMIDGKPYAVSGPSDYCSKGPAVDSIMEVQRQFSADMVPAAIFVRCSARPEDVDELFTIQQSPRADKVTRQAFLNGFRRAMPQIAERGGALKEPLDKMADRMSDIFDTRVNAEANIAPVSVDDMCGYLAGIIKVGLAGESIEMGMVGCATAISDRVVYVFRLRAGMTGERARAATAEVAQLARTIVPVP